METHTLLSMTEFVKKEYDKIPEIPTQREAVKFAITVNNYAKFLSQPLTLSMFVPCDDKGNVLEEPYIQRMYHMVEHRPYSEIEKEYNKAKENVLFEGFEWNPATKQAYNKKIGLTVDKAIVDKSKHSVEYLLLFNPVLSATALKQIYG